MSRLLKVIIFIFLFASYLQPLGLGEASPAAAQAASSPALPLCLPGVYPTDPQDCIPLGPSGFRTRMASQGITFPMLPLPAQPRDAALATLPYYYAVLGENPTPVYPSLDDAIAGRNEVRVIAPGPLRYVSYRDYADTDNGRFFELRQGGWVRVSSRVGIPHSYPGGIVFEQAPHNSFGWVLPFGPTIETKRTPGFANPDYTGHLINQYALVQIYDSQVVEDTEWYLVGPDEWVDQRLVGRVTPNPTPPEGVTNGRWIEVNLFEQTLAVYDQSRLVFATLIASGMEPFYTRPGLFPIYHKLDTTPMSGAFTADRSDYYYLEDVPYTMYYDEARALHGAYWRTAFGFPQSHGCVNLAPGDARWLFEWAQEGDWVYVWDPSGQTPTDPDYYGEGGA